MKGPTLAMAVVALTTAALGCLATAGTHPDGSAGSAGFGALALTFFGGIVWVFVVAAHSTAQRGEQQ